MPYSPVAAARLVVNITMHSGFFRQLWRVVIGSIGKCAGDVGGRAVHTLVMFVFFSSNGGNYYFIRDMKNDIEHS